MPFVLGSAVGRVTLNTRGWMRSMSMVNRSLGGMAKVSRSAAASMRNLGLSMTALSVPLGVVSKTLGRGFLEAAADMEQYRLRLEALVRDTQRANEYLSFMKDLAKEVPAEFQDIVKVGTNLAGVLKGNTDEAKKFLRMTADLSSVLSLTFVETGTQIQRIISAGIGAADQFREHGVNAILGFEHGVKLSLARTRAKLLEAWMDPDSQFRDAAQRLATTWRGVMSMFRDKWFLFKDAVMEVTGIFDDVRDTMIRLNIALNQNWDTMVKWLRTNKELVRSVLLWASGLTLAFMGLAGLITTTWLFSIALGALISPLGAVLAGIFSLAAGTYALRALWNQNWMNMRNEVLDMVDSLKGLKGTLSELSPLLESMFKFTLGPVTAVVRGLTTLNKIVLRNWLAVRGFVSAVVKMGTSLWRMMVMPIRAGAEALQTLAWILQDLSRLMKSGEFGLENVSAVLKRHSEGFHKWFAQHMEERLTDLNESVITLGEAGSKVWADAFVANITDAFHALVGVVDDQMRGAMNQWPSWFAPVGRFFENTFPQWMDVAKAGWQAAGQDIKTQMNEDIDAIASKFKWLIDIFTLPLPERLPIAASMKESLNEISLSVTKFGIKTREELEKDIELLVNLADHFDRLGDTHALNQVLDKLSALTMELNASSEGVLKGLGVEFTADVEAQIAALNMHKEAVMGDALALQSWNEKMLEAKLTLTQGAGLEGLAAGLKLGIMDAKKAWMDWGNQARSIIANIERGIGTSLSGAFKDFIKGTKSAGEAFEAFADKILDIAIDAMADIAAAAIKNAAITAFASAFGGPAAGAGAGMVLGSGAGAGNFPEYPGPGGLGSAEQITGARGLSFTIINNFTPEAIAAQMSSESGENVIVNTVTENMLRSGTIRQMIRGEMAHAV